MQETAPICYTLRMTTEHSEPNQHPHTGTKLCAQCGEMKPLNEFLRRTGRRAGGQGRRGTCRDCRRGRQSVESLPAKGAVRHPQHAPKAEAAQPSAGQGSQAASSSDPATSKQRGRGHKRRPAAQPRLLAEPPKRGTHDPADASYLRTTASGFIRMRGKTDNGRRWYQEVELELAQILVREGAAVVVNRSTIRRLYSNKEFRKLILTRDNYTCRFCGQYGDTIDHELPRAKGGHTTPSNCICACYECNQRKANRDVDEFRSSLEDEFV
ncbi:HNH endonuclease [Paenibacillus sp. PAMC21692]|nr:HNH endonuclease [Paenibacillus sp. PAMC21692]